MLGTGARRGIREGLLSRWELAGQVLSCVKVSVGVGVPVVPEGEQLEQRAWDWGVGT